MQFEDQLLTLEEEYADFRREFLRNGTASLLKDFTRAVNAFDKMHEPIKKMKGFRHANVHLINSVGRKVTWEEKEMFEKFCALYEES